MSFFFFFLTFFGPKICEHFGKFVFFLVSIQTNFAIFWKNRQNILYHNINK
jgi:hypothetical protein